MDSKRATAAGLKVLVDFHYSDFWADPSKQQVPKAWKSFEGDADKTADTVYDYTKQTLTTFKQAGVDVGMVQVGNETNDGMLWPEGRASTNMAGYAALIGAGAKAVRETSPTSKVVVHLANGGDNALFRWSFDGLKKNNVDWDVIGMSLYPEPST